VDALSEAPFDQRRWPEALRLLTAAGGGWGAQIVGVSREAGIVFDHAWGIPEETLRDFERLGGADPQINPRARLLLSRPPRVVGDHNLATPDELASNTLYQTFFEKHDAPYFAGAHICGQNGRHVVLAVVRSHEQGHVQAKDIETLQRLLPELCRAVRIQQRLEDSGPMFAAGAFEAASIAAAICDRQGRLIAVTPAGEQQLAREAGLVHRRGRIEACDSACDDALQAALRRATEPSARAASSTVVLRDARGRSQIVDVAPLPRREFSLYMDSACVVLFGRQTPKNAADLLMSAFSVSPAEAAVAIDLGEGREIAEIATARRVSIATIRNQRKALFGKLGVHSRAELTGVLAPIFWRHLK
jgi:DNA-binding CsgD family transcriptional regulator